MPPVRWKVGAIAERLHTRADLLELAASWHERLASAEPNENGRAAFERWQSTDPAHADAYACVCQAHRAARAVADAPEILALRHEALARIVVPARRPAWREALAAGTAALLIGSATVWVWQAGPPKPASNLVETPVAGRTPASVYRTGVGERLTVALSDGSTAALNTSTRLRLAYHAGERRLILEAGQALFEVAPGQARPFVVVAGDRLVTAHGTAFDVRIDRQRIKVALLEGEVSVARNGSAATAHATRLHPNDVLIASGNLTSVRKVEDAGQYSSWRDGLLIFENERLGDAIGEINRYVARPIGLDDPELAELRISGAFMTGQTQAFVEALELGFALRVVEQSPQRIILGGAR